jgi:two-component system, cell cycle sensor histidine kinase and response regulator CckA
MSVAAQPRKQEKPFDPALLMAGVDVCSQGIAVSESGRILYANQAFGKASRFVANPELRGQLLTDLLPQNTQYLDSREASFSPDNAIVQIEASISNFQDNQRDFQLVCIRSLSEPNKRDVPAPQPRKPETIDRSLPGIAHDFGNVLTGILLYSDLLVEGLDAASRLRRYAEAIRVAGANGVALIQQLTNPSPEDSLVIQPLSLNQVISEMASLLTRLVGETVEIKTHLAKLAGLVKIEASKVQQIILNLTLNARHAMPNGGQITLSTRNCTQRIANSEKKLSQPVPCVEFSVTDSGTGMDKETLAQAFRPFFTTKPRTQGHGLGLSMVQSIVKQAGGEVEIESELGKGTRVTIRVPRIDVANESN